VPVRCTGVYRHKKALSTNMLAYAYMSARIIPAS